jgi:hypothetical protein
MVPIVGSPTFRAIGAASFGIRIIWLVQIGHTAPDEQCSLTLA